MKKFLSWTLACLLLCTLTLPALANEYGLKGGIFSIVSGNDAYDGYGADADDDDRMTPLGRYVNHAILSSRYHSVLIAAKRGLLGWTAEAVSTAAVYQPDDARSRDVVLEHLTDEDGFRLRYGSEEYTFQWAQELEAYVLMSARYDVDSGYGSSLRYSTDEELRACYELWEGGPENSARPIGDARWYCEPITLENFNITLLPRTMQDVRQMNKVGDFLRLTAKGVLGDGVTRTGVKDGILLPVYSAPDEHSFRAAKGKAAVSTGGDVKVLGVTGEWTMVSYEVSRRTSRIGYVHARLAEEDFTVPFSSVSHDLFAIRDTYLTDDPDVSQYAQTTIPEGAKMRGVAVYGPYYAHVQYEADEVLYRGFVPLKDLTNPSAEQDLSVYETDYDPSVTYRWDIADLMVGKWDACVEEKLAEGFPRLVLYSDGGFEARGGGEDVKREFCGYGGIWRIRDTAEDSPLSGHAPYTLTFIGEDGEAWVWGLVFEDPSCITLMNGEGSVRYERTEYSTWGNG